MTARLVACGYKEDSHNLKTDSSTRSHEARLTASVMKGRVESLDFTSVFLQGDKLKRDISWTTIEHMSRVTGMEVEKRHLWIE